MAGHSHSANIKFRKDRVDAKRAKAFSKLAQMITVAARTGGGDPDANPRLRLAIEKARVINMPKDNIQRAIKKGIGEGGPGDYEEILYEGYGPCGVAVMLDILTDKRTRTAPEVRKIFERAGGSMASAGSVAFNFDRKAVFVVRSGAGLSEDRLMEIALEAGAEDLVAWGDTFAIHAEPGEFVAVKEALEAREVPLEDASVTYVAKTTVELGDADDARKVINLLDALEDHDDVQTVAANHVIPDSIASAMSSEEE